MASVSPYYLLQEGGRGREKNSTNFQDFPVLDKMAETRELSYFLYKPKNDLHYTAWQYLNTPD